MHTQITAILLELTTVPEESSGEPPLSRKQIAGWIGKSQSYVDQRFQGHEDFRGEDIDIIIQKAFELDIPRLKNRYLPDGQRIVDYKVAKYILSGKLDDNIAAIMTDLVKVKGIGKDCADTDRLIDHIHEEAETIRKELEAKPS